ncbi:MAG: DUF427 domain-containing protein [Myxococcota bacterium]
MPDAVVTPGPGQESVWDYPRPPAVERVEVRVEVFVGDDRIADSVRCLRVLETAGPPTVYFPPGDVRTDALRSAAGGSICEWKGAASYFRLADAVGAGAPVGWRYERPFPEYAVLAGYVSFYPGRVTRCVYGGDAVRPQPGRFYGGWITPNLVGPFKGEPGSEGW